VQQVAHPTFSVCPTTTAVLKPHADSIKGGDIDATLKLAQAGQIDEPAVVAGRSQADGA